MSDPHADRLARVRALLEDPARSEPERLARAMEALSGLSSTDFSVPDWRRILRHLARVNDVLRRYRIETAADYAHIRPSDLAEIRSQLTRLGRRLRAPTPHGTDEPAAEQSPQRARPAARA